MAITLKAVGTVAQTGGSEEIEKIARNVDGELLAQKNSELLYSLLRPLANLPNQFASAPHPLLGVLAKHGNPVMVDKNSSNEVAPHMRLLRTNHQPLAQNFTQRCDALRVNGVLARATMGREAEEIVRRPARKCNRRTHWPTVAST